MRDLKRGTILRYGYVIYNPKLSRLMTVQPPLIGDDKVIYEEKQVPVKPDRQPDLMRLQTFGTVSLGSNLETGSYTLQVIVSDRISNRKDSFNTQFIEPQTCRSN